MKLSISNIGWLSKQDSRVYEMMKKYGFSGLEIAPTRIFPENPYDHLKEAGEWAKKIKEQYGFVVPSMQSIWYGRQEKIFGTQEEFNALVTYTKKAIDFASVIGCKNLVFGCPRNRNLPDGADSAKGVEFFKILGDYAASRETVIGMEANPIIYNTNYINDTRAAIELIRKVNSDGFKLNLDVGTMIYNQEDIDELVGNVGLINHVHISEPGLKPIESREIHSKLKDIWALCLLKWGKLTMRKYLKKQQNILRRCIEYDENLRSGGGRWRCLSKNQAFTGLFYVGIILMVIMVSIIKFRGGEINYLDSDATWHTLLTMQAYDETPISQHKFLPIVSLGGVDNKGISWGATIPDKEGNFYYTSFSPAGFVLPYLFIKVFRLPINEKSLYYFNTLLFAISAVLWAFF
jgi:sugar phosphate isomerase/epimerase